MRHIIFIFTALLYVIFLSSCTNNDAIPNERFETYVKQWEKHEFTVMYDMLSEEAKDTYDTEQFIDRYSKVYEDFQVENLQISFDPLSKEQLKQVKDEGEAIFPISVKMDTIAGPIQFDYEAKLIEEGEKNDKNWFVQWDPGLIFPDLKDGGKLNIQTEEPRRGEILDRNKMPLAINDTVYEIGIVPEKLGENAEATKQRLAQLLHMTVDAIDEALEEDWVQPDLFVPLSKVPKTEENILNELWQLSGVTGREVTGRIYPAGKATAHLVGYIGQITAEELDKAEPGKYSSNDMIGKRGIEQLFEEDLKGKKGIKIVITKDDEEDIVLAEKPVEDGKNIELTIDVNIQEKIFNSYDQKAGTAAAIDPKTGETIALVSSPAFDPNDMLYGMKQEDMESLQNHPQKPLINRFTATFAPGSVIKPITGAVGLENGSIIPDEGIEIHGLTWNNGKGWGDYKVRRVSGTDSKVDLTDALVRSDNIYFAMKSVQMGSEDFIKGLKSFGFEEDLPYVYPFTKSTISSTGKLGDEISLANTSYGQAEVEMSALHLALTYTTFINDGNMIKPTLLTSEETGQVWHENVISPKHADFMQKALREVVTKGTAKVADRENLPISGKTGTAELKKSAKSKGHENGWFVGYPTEEQDIILALMIEHAEDIGTSALAAETVADILEDIK